MFNTQSIADVCGSGDLLDLNGTIPVGCGGLHDVYGQDTVERCESAVTSRVASHFSVLQVCFDQRHGFFWNQKPAKLTPRSWPFLWKHVAVIS